jgi:hypothetical protein
VKVLDNENNLPFLKEKNGKRLGFIKENLVKIWKGNF